MNEIPDNYTLFEAYEREQERIERRGRRLEIEEESDTEE